MKLFNRNLTHKKKVKKSIMQKKATFHLKINTSVLKSFCILLPLLLCLSTLSRATNYYFSSSTGNDSYTSTQAQNQATPWKTIAKLNSFFSSIVAGDKIFFKRGDTFYGGIILTKSGSSASAPITFADYGSGSLPIISGFTTISSWTSIGNNIFQANISAATSTLNIVSLNGVPQRMGRYPNNTATGDPYLYYESFTSNTSGGTITDNQLTTSTNWTGADVVIRKKRWIMDRVKITGHSGGTLTYSQANGYSGINGFGYFIENDPRTLDQLGEWYFNTSTKNLQVHFGGGLPSSYSLRVSTIDVLMNLGAQRFITIQNLAFEGANITGLTAPYGSDITIQQCTFNQIGKNGIIISGSPNTLLDNVSLSYVLNNPIDILNSNVSNTIVKNCSINNCSLFAGMGDNGDGNYEALKVQVSSGGTIAFNNINNVGYTAIAFQGNNFTINNNFINNFSSVKDDGGGIYTAVSNTLPITNFYNRKIYSNIVINGIGAPNGTAGKTGEVNGIYMDEAANNVDIYDNSIANIARTGILLNNTTYVKVLRNTIYNSKLGIEMNKLMATNNVRNMELKRNIVYPTAGSQSAIYYKNFYLSIPTSLTIDQDMKLVGKIDSNYYSTPSTIGFSYYACQNYSTNPGSLIISPGFALETWKTMTGQENTSKRPAKAATSITDLNFQYNASGTSKVVAFSGLSYMDVAGTVYNNSITIPAWSSVVLVANGTATTTNKAPVANAGTDKIITLPTNTSSLIGSGTDADGTISSYAWVQLSGPSTGTIATANTSSTVINNLVQGVYQYQLNVTDNSGAVGRDTVQLTVNLSTALPPSNLLPAVNPANIVNGLDYKYYEGTWSVLPAFSTLTPVKTGTVLNFDLTPANNTTLYGFNFTGYINVPADGIYTFYTSSDDGSSLYIDNVLTVNNDGLHGAVEKSGTIGLMAGKHAISGLFFQGTGGAVFQVSYSATGIAKQLIPSSVLYRVAPLTTTNLLPAVNPANTVNGLDYKYYQGNWSVLPPFSTLTPVKTGTVLNFDLTPATSTTLYGFVFTGYINVPADGIYTFYSTSDDGSSVYIDNVLTVNNDGQHGAIEKSGSIGLKAGKHAIYGLFFQQTGGAVFKVSYSSTTIAKQLIPASSLYRVTTTARVASTTTLSSSTNTLSVSNAVASPLKISSYPNPTRTEFGLLVEGGSNEKISILVSSVDGRIVFNGIGTTNKTYKFGNSFLSGLYIIKVIQGNNIQVLKVLKVE